MHLALRARRLGFWPKFLLYSVFASALGLVPGEVASLSFFLPLVLGLVLQPPPPHWLRRCLALLPVAGLPLLAWAVQVPWRGVEGMSVAVSQTLRFWALLAASNLLASLLSPPQVYRAFAPFPALAQAMALFFTYLAWLDQEWLALREAAELRPSRGLKSTLRLRAAQVLSLMVRGLQRSNDVGDALLLRSSARVDTDTRVSHNFTPPLGVRESS